MNQANLATYVAVLQPNNNSGFTQSFIGTSLLPYRSAQGIWCSTESEVKADLPSEFNDATSLHVEGNYGNDSPLNVFSIDWSYSQSEEDGKIYQTISLNVNIDFVEWVLSSNTSDNVPVTTFDLYKSDGTIYDIPVYTQMHICFGYWSKQFNCLKVVTITISKNSAQSTIAMFTANGGDYDGARLPYINFISYLDLKFYGSGTREFRILMVNPNDEQSLSDSPLQNVCQLSGIEWQSKINVTKFN